MMVLQCSPNHRWSRRLSDSASRPRTFSSPWPLPQIHCSIPCKTPNLGSGALLYYDNSLWWIPDWFLSSFYPFVWRGCKAMKWFIAQTWFRFCQLKYIPVRSGKCEWGRGDLPEPCLSLLGSRVLLSWNTFWWTFSWCPGCPAGLG